MDGHVYGYQLDPAFIHIDDQKEILDFIAKSSTNDEVSNWLMKVVEGLDHKLTTIETKISGRAVNPKHEISDRTKIFFSIFKDPGMVTPLLRFLAGINVTDEKGKWIGLTKGKMDLMSFMDTSKIKSPITFTNYTEIGKIFKNEFNVSISERSMTADTFVRTDARTEYLSLIDDFLLEYRQSKF